MAKTTSTKVAETPKRVVKDYELYFTDNGRVVCGRHCGASAAYTGRDISGQKIKRVTDRAKAAWLAETGEQIDCEDCHAIAVRMAAQYKPAARIIFKTASPWVGPSGRGLHEFTVEMKLESIRANGPDYVLVKVISETGAPPTGAHSAPSRMGCVWDAIADQIARGAVTPITDGGAA